MFVFFQVVPCTTVIKLAPDSIFFFFFMGEIQKLSYRAFSVEKVNNTETDELTAYGECTQRGWSLQRRAQVRTS